MKVKKLGRHAPQKNGPRKTIKKLSLRNTRSTHMSRAEKALPEPCFQSRLTSVVFRAHVRPVLLRRHPACGFPKKGGPVGFIENTSVRCRRERKTQEIRSDEDKATNKSSHPKLSPKESPALRYARAYSAEHKRSGISPQKNICASRFNCIPFSPGPDTRELPNQLLGVRAH